MYPFTEGSFAPRNGWYVAGFCNEIGEALLSRWILNEPVVLYRTSAGEAVAVQGRCPHRHYPLGASLRVGDAIQCGYHGITFDAGGKCTFVPSQMNVPGVLQIKSYPLVERGLWAWIWPGDPSLADEGLIPDMAEIGFELPGYVAEPCFSLHVDGRYQLLNDNLLDLTHLGYLHSSSIGTPDDAATPEQREVTERKISSRRFMHDTPQPPFLAEKALYGGNVDRVSGMDFHLPGFHAGLGEFRVPPGDPSRAGELILASRIWHAVTPAKKHTTNYFFAMSAQEGEDLAAAKVYLKPVLDEDAFATEEIEKIVQAMDVLPPELMLKSDATAVIGRRAMQALMDLEKATAA